MASIYENLKTDRQYSSSTGLNKAKFEELHQTFSQYFVPKKTNSLTKVAPRFTDSREALFFVLYYLKVYPTLQVYGLTFGISDFSASNNYEHIIPFLKASLASKLALVPRIFDSQESFDKVFKDVPDLYIDGTEIAIERAENDDIQTNVLTV